MSNRDQVRTEPRERIDRPDFDAVQRGDRADVRATARDVLTGTGSLLSLGGWTVAAAGTPDATVTVSAGTALGAVLLDDGSYEYGVTFGNEGDTSQVLDMTGKPNGTYGIWIRPSFEAGTVGNRVFWDANAGAEVVSAIDTRYVAGWDSRAALVSPGTEWQQVASVVWAGATVAPGDITGARSMFFEGNETGGFAALWGDGVNDRSTDRGTYGVGDLYTWVQAVRRVITDIYDNGQKWYEVPSYTLADAKAHQDDVTDPHSSTPTWTGTIKAAGLDLGQVPSFYGSYPPLFVYRSFTAFRWDPNATNGDVVKWGPSATDPRYVWYGAGNALGPDLVLSLTETIGQLLEGSAKIEYIYLYWNQETLAAVSNGGNKIVWRVEGRSHAQVQGDWTVIDSGEISGGSEYDIANPAENTLVTTLNADYTYHEVRLVLNLHGTVDGQGPFIYGVKIFYRPYGLIPT